jgi:hypothetical protein
MQVGKNPVAPDGVSLKTEPCVLGIVKKEKLDPIIAKRLT